MTGPVASYSASPPPNTFTPPIRLPSMNRWSSRSRRRCRRTPTSDVDRVALLQPEQAAARLHGAVEVRGRERQAVQAQAVGGVRLLRRDDAGGGPLIAFRRCPRTRRRGRCRSDPRRWPTCPGRTRRCWPESSDRSSERLDLIAASAGSGSPSGPTEPLSVVCRRCTPPIASASATAAAPRRAPPAARHVSCPLLPR